MVLVSKFVRVMLSSKSKSVFCSCVAEGIALQGNPLCFFGAMLASFPVFINNFSDLRVEVYRFQIKVYENLTDGGNFIIGFFFLIDNKEIFIIETAEASFSSDGLGKEIFINNPDVELG